MLHCLLPWMNSAAACPWVQMGEVKPSNYLERLKNVSPVLENITESTSQLTVLNSMVYKDKQYGREIIR